VKIQFMSDLHLEVHPQWQPQVHPDADVLVLAGDIGSYQVGTRLLDTAQPRFGLERFASWPVPVLYVPGNHEFDDLEYAHALARLPQVCAELGIAYLHGRAKVLGGVRFVGSTLWTDFDALANCMAYKPASYRDALTRRLALREKAFTAANHYLQSNSSLQRGKPMLADAVRELALAAQAELAELLAQPHAGRTVVVTHFAPTLDSADPRYGLQPGTAGFCNQLDASLLAAADLWIHGHLHCRVDVQLATPRASDPAHRTRVLCNPLGYARKGEQAAFDPLALVDV
jgi:Calcineurin-like phosphoesterase